MTILEQSINRIGNCLNSELINEEEKEKAIEQIFEMLTSFCSNYNWEFDDIFHKPENKTPSTKMRRICVLVNSSKQKM